VPMAPSESREEQEHPSEEGEISPLHSIIAAELFYTSERTRGSRIDLLLKFRFAVGRKMKLDLACKPSI
jgi:hypothetical protein